MLILAIIINAGCSSGSDPVTFPGDTVPLASDNNSIPSGTCLWGYYDILLDLENYSAEAVLNRNVMFAVNVVTFLNNNPATLGFGFNSVTNNGDNIEVDLDLSITHPIPDQPKFNGYDVRGILVSAGSGGMKSNYDLQYPVDGTDQFLVNSDGYTRWFNQAEFGTEGIFGYTPGIYASSGFLGNSTLNAYKYFTDDLGTTEDEYDFLCTYGEYHGVFTSGATITRNYIIRFPIPTPAVKYGYAVVANWEGAQPSDHPSNSEEAAACEIYIYPDLYYTSDTDKGGGLRMDVSLLCWKDLPTSIVIESTVLSNFYYLSASEMTPVLTGENWAEWHVDVAADNLNGTEGNEFWVLAIFGGHNYASPTGIPNEAETDSVTSAFRYDLFIADEPYDNSPPVIQSGVDGPTPVSPDAVADYSVVAVDPNGDDLTYSWRVTKHDSPTIVHSGPGDGAGLFPIDWYGDCNAENGMAFDIYCDVADGFNDPVPADILVVDIDNQPPYVSDISGPLVSSPQETQTYSVEANDPDGDDLDFLWEVFEHDTTNLAYSDAGDGAGSIDINWETDVGADWSESYDVFCSVSDTWNPDVQVGPVVVEMKLVLYHYDGTVDDGEIVVYTGSGSPVWSYCPSTLSWDENNCEPYTQGLISTCMTPVIEFPEEGTFNTIHYEIWHWGDMQGSGTIYSNLATLEPKGGGTYNILMNSVTSWLEYIEGFDFNDGPWDDWIGVFGTESEPEYSHFNCNAYAGETYAIGFSFYQSGDYPNPGNEGWNVRELIIWVE